MALLVSQTYAGVYLNAADLAPLGRRRAATVHATASELIGQEQKPMIVLDLVSSAGKAWPKRAVLNKSNSLQLAAAFGDDATFWPGKRIEIWAENVMFQGRMVPGIKVLPAAAQQTSGSGTGGATTTIPDDAPQPAAVGGPQWGGPGSDLDDEIPF